MKPPVPGAASRPRAARIAAVGGPLPKRFFLIAAALVCLLSASFAQYSIPWWRVAGGGGTSTGGPFSITGTIGQFEAGGPMSFNQFSMSGGFWALPVAVQVAGAPTLNIAKTVPGFAMVWWTPPSTNWVLQETVSLTGTWSNAPTGWTNPVTVPTLPPRKFYRLFRP